MNNYSKAVIYTIRTDNGLYVGSTYDFKQRKRIHKSNIYNENCKCYNCKLYQNIRENDGDWSMEILHLFPCENGIELRQEETRVMTELNANLNMMRAYLTEQEKMEYNFEYHKLYDETHRDELNVNSKRHYEKHKEKINAKNKLYQEKNKEKLNVYKKLYRENNREELNAKHKLYDEKNKEKIKARKSEKITCECGCESARGNITQHRRSKRHLNLMKLLDEK